MLEMLILLKFKKSVLMSYNMECCMSTTLAEAKGIASVYNHKVL